MKPVALFIFVLSLWPDLLAAQAYGRGFVQCSKQEVAAGVIRGHLVPRSDSISLSRGMWLSRGDERVCGLLSDSTGAFEFAVVPAGSYRVDVGGLGLQPFSAIPVDMAVADSVTLGIPIHAADPVSECMRRPACATVLARATSAELRGVPERSLSLAGHRVGIALSVDAWGDAGPPVACVPADVVDPLGEIFEVAPESECGPVSASQGARQRLHHLPSGREAVGITLEQVESADARVSVIHVSYLVGGLWAAGFRCLLEMDHSLWVPVQCRLTWVS